MRSCFALVALFVAFAAACSSSSANPPTGNEPQSGSCVPGQPCTCISNGGCDLGCSGKGCTVDCVGNGSCNVSCPEGGCTVNCKGNGSCNIINCAGGGCKCTKFGNGSCNGG